MTDNKPDPVTDVWELLWTAACDYRDTAGPDRSEAQLIDALMPIVREYAASQLEQIADQQTWTTEHDNEVVSSRSLYEHAARLRGELEPVTFDFPPEDAP